MKTVTYTLVLLCLLSFSARAAVRTVSNDSKAPAQHTSINDAISASSQGDTILVYGSSSSYGDVHLDRQVVLIGAGYNNPYGPNTIINRLNLNNGAGALSASNSKISGFQISNVYFNGEGTAPEQIVGVLIERCLLHFIRFHQWVLYRNDTIRNCLIKDNDFDYYAGSFENIQVHNNIFDNQRIYKYYYTISGDSVYIRNNVFLRHSANVFVNVQNLTVENNIFYGAQPQGCVNCAFNNNMTYLNANDTLVNSTGNPGSVGSGNYIGEDPQFVTYPPGGGAYSYDHDLNVQNANAVNGGTDGKDMGIHGGMLPYTPGANPSIPQMTEISFPANASSVKLGGTLNVTFKAKKQD